LELALKSCDWERERFSFSLRDTLADPWGKVGSRYLEGQSYDGIVARLAPFGAFVTLEEGIDGLVPISKLGDGRRLKHAQEALKIGQKLRVSIEKIDTEQRRISLAPAEAAAGEELPSSYQEGSTGGLGTLGDLLRAAPTKKRER
jgi:small subunit ribosomal protein S1